MLAIAVAAVAAAAIFVVPVRPAGAPLAARPDAVAPEEDAVAATRPHDDPRLEPQLEPRSDADAETADHRVGGDDAARSVRPVDEEATQLAADRGAGSALPAEARTRRDLRVLVCEDDALVRSLTCHMLQGTGAQTLEASDGEQALRFASVAADPIDLVVTDVRMPGMSGPDMVHRLRDTRPDLPVVFMSGFTQGLLDDQMRRAPNTVFLAKPFRPRDLHRAIDEALRAADRVEESRRAADELR